MPLASVRSSSCHPPPATPSVCPLPSLPSSKSGYAPQAHPVPCSSGRPCQRILPPAHRPGPLPPHRQRRHSLRAPGAARCLDYAGRGAQARASISAASPPPARCHSEGTHARGTAQTCPAPGASAADEARTWDPHQGAHGRVRPVEGDGVTRRRATSPRSCGRTAPLPAAPASQPMAPARWLRPRWPRRAD